MLSRLEIELADAEADMTRPPPWWLGLVAMTIPGAVVWLLLAIF
jgi:hypothetical protein